MRKIKANYFVWIFTLFTAFAYSQGKINGVILDTDSGMGLPGVNLPIRSYW